MTMNLRNRRLLLVLASWLDRRAKRIRRYVADVTPKRGKRILTREPTP